MTVRTLRTNEWAIPSYRGNRIPRALAGKINIVKKVRYIIEETDWDTEILKGERWIDLFCWSVLGFSALYFCVIGLRIFIR